ncbi:hypothetical protein ACFVP8_20365 [Viridibacillus arvi]|uniref:hypothetical protein n=1 Tax=Viridibacillus arvi TaxID=263475 RepID=UPI0036C08AE5
MKELAIVEETVERNTINNKQIVIEKHLEVYDHNTQILHCTSTSEIIENGTLIITNKDSILLRYTFPLELERLLKSNGFELVELYGSWKKTRFNKDSVSMVVHCRLND